MTPGVSPWRGRARCRGHAQPWLWFSGFRKDIDTARAMCFACPVRANCLASQLCLEEEDRRTYDGMFGGRTEKERKVILRMRGAV